MTMLPATIWVAELRISDRTAEKITGKHGIEIDDLRRVLVGREGLTFAWDDRPDRGLRAIVELHLGSRRILAVLYPVNDPMGDVWNLGSAYEV